MPRKFLRRWLPSQKKLAENVFMHRFGHWFSDPRLWHLNRRSVAGGVAAGAIGGLIPGPLQIMTAALLALVFRVNLPVAALVTFYSNPVSIGPLYWLAYKLGSLLIGGNVYAALPPIPSWSEQGLLVWIQQLALWAWSLGLPLAIGLPALAVVLAVFGYVLVDQGWRLHVRWMLWRRSRRKPSA
ncbi:MAG: DUF2062 domain-containing protein [Formivibrio sp.]|nr:DUF2062 domain-containing protein [Formivibrio sp.]